MAANFESAVAEVLKHEGGYVNDPHDPGGETNFGICKRDYPHEDIKGMTEERAKEIYFRDYWQPWQNLPQSIAVKAFDLAVNCGTKTVAAMVQRAICSVGISVAVDGSIGPRTIEAAGQVDEADLLYQLKREALAHYDRLVQARPELSKFLRGWHERALS